MAKKNFVSYGDAETLMSEIADKFDSLPAPTPAPDLSAYETSWTGTQDEWDALDDEEKAKYQIVNITDDESASVTNTYLTTYKSISSGTLTDNDWNEMATLDLTSKGLWIVFGSVENSGSTHPSNVTANLRLRYQNNVIVKNLACMNPIDPSGSIAWILHTDPGVDTIALDFAFSASLSSSSTFACKIRAVKVGN